MASSNLFAYKVCSESEIETDSIFSRLKQYPDSENEYFNLELVDDSELIGEYVTVRNIREVFYNPEDRSFSDRIVPRAEVISFTLKNYFLEIWGNKTSADRILFMFSKVFPEIRLDVVEISLTKMLEKLKKYNIKVGKVCIQDLLLTEDIVGNLTVDLSLHSNAYDILKKYSKQIANMTVTICFPNNTLKIRVTQKGRITVYKAHELLEEEEQAFLHDLLIDRGEE